MPGKRILWIVMALLAMQCTTKEADPFLIQKEQIGKLLKTTTVKELDSVYALDSIVKRSDEGNYTYTSNDKYLIYEKGGKHLLTLTPVQEHDSLETIANIRIMDARFKTAEGISLNSTFQEIKEQYPVRVSATFNNVLIFADTIDAFFTIDKKQLPASLQQPGATITAAQLPGTVKMKYFMIAWE